MTTMRAGVNKYVGVISVPLTLRTNSVVLLVHDIFLHVHGTPVGLGTASHGLHEHTTTPLFAAQYPGP